MIGINEQEKDNLIRNISKLLEQRGVSDSVKSSICNFIRDFQYNGDEPKNIRNSLAKKMAIIEEIKKLLENNKLNDKQKASIYNMVMASQRTDLKKERFNMYYGLGPYKDKRMSLEDIAKYYNVSKSAIRDGINNITYSLNNMQGLENILDEYHKKIGIPRVNYTFDQRDKIVCEILKIAQKDLFDETQKSALIKIINNITNITETQRNRFLLCYNLKENEPPYRLCDIAEQEHCSQSAVRSSILNMKNKLIHIENEDMYILESILKEFNK